MKERTNKEYCMEKDRIVEKQKQNEYGARQKGNGEKTRNKESKVGSRDKLRILQTSLRDEAASMTTVAVVVASLPFIPFVNAILKQGDVSVSFL
jgi:hypothetical protein